MSTAAVPPFPIATRVAGRTVRDPDEVSLQLVRAAVAGRDSRLPRARAFALLLESDFPNKHRDFEGVLADNDETPQIRHLAALYLGKVSTPAAQAILLQHLGVSEEYVLEGVLAALGRTADASAFNVLERLQRTLKGSAASCAALAAELISHRYGLAGTPRPLPPEGFVSALPAGSPRIEVARADVSDAELCLRSLEREPFGVELAESPMYSMRCGRNLWKLVLSRDAAGVGAVERLSARSMLLGLVARRVPSTGLYGAAFVILTTPNDQGSVDILVHRASGGLVAGGTGRRNAGNVAFSVRSVKPAVTFEFQIEGTLVDGRLEVTTALSRPGGNKRRPLQQRRALVKR